MKHRLIVLVLLVISSTTFGQSATPARAAKPVQRVLMISIDGLRPDVLLRGDAPRLRGLLNRGSFTMWARTTPASVTLPSHTSMVTGQPPEVHNITWNGDLPFSEPVFPRVPTLFEVGKKAGLTTAMAAGKRKFAVLNKPGSIDLVHVEQQDAGDDAAVATNAARFIRERQPEVMFVHFAGCDRTGHADGWGTASQLSALAAIDRYLGTILDALAERKLLEATLIIVTSDHGGFGRNHGPDDVHSRTIPWIAAGPGIRANLDLTSVMDRDVEVYDTLPTICALMGLRPPAYLKGHVINEMLERRELIAPVKP